MTLPPESGGRILSMIYQPTDDESLYVSPDGVPHQIDTDAIFIDWLIVYGGIFPTLPEPEDGETWLLPWDFEVTEETEEAVTAAMPRRSIDRPPARRHPVALADPVSRRPGARGLCLRRDRRQ